MNKLIKIFGVISGILMITFAIMHKLDFGKDVDSEFGVTFSQKYAEELDLDWKEVYSASLEDLKIKKYRLSAYWDIMEPEKDKYDFSDLDWQIAQAEKNKAEVILAIGHRLPRWPECHWPKWIYQVEEKERQEELQELLELLVNRYKESESIVMWQVENEPFLKVFGECPRQNLNYLQDNIDLVKSLDDRSIVITESGELSTWIPGAKRADYVGTSMYRVVWNKAFGYFSYDWLPASFYAIKARIVKKFFPVNDIFISEMQMEPWTPGMPLLKTSFEEQAKSMSLGRFRKNLAYAEKTGMTPVYLWGVEWWYWLKEQGDSSIWKEAKMIWEE